MIALAIARVIEHRRRRGLASERPIIADINPTSPDIAFALGQNRHCRVVSVQAFGRHHMGFQPRQ
jgi:hypothetical protein